MFLRLFRAEVLKMREPITLLALLAGPGLAGALTLVGTVQKRPELSWEMFLGQMTNFWLMLLFPLSVVAFTTFAGQVEHRARAWDHLLMLPVPKWMTFAVKVLVMTLAIVAMNVLFLVLVIAGGKLGGPISSVGPFTGPIPLEAVLRHLALAGVAGGLLMLAVQVWLSLRFSHFIVPILVGFAGVTCGAGGAIFRHTGNTRYLPWGTPNEVLTQITQKGPDLEHMLVYGVGGGLIVFVAMCIHLSRREMR
jgi:lantibiotic transport system permease protein